MTDPVLPVVAVPAPTIQVQFTEFAEAGSTALTQLLGPVIDGAQPLLTDVDEVLGRTALAAGLIAETVDEHHFASYEVDGNVLGFDVEVKVTLDEDNVRFVRFRIGAEPEPPFNFDAACDAFRVEFERKLALHLGPVADAGDDSQAVYVLARRVAMANGLEVFDRIGVDLTAGHGISRGRVVHIAAQVTLISPHAEGHVTQGTYTAGELVEGEGRIPAELLSELEVLVLPSQVRGTIKADVTLDPPYGRVLAERAAGFITFTVAPEVEGVLARALGFNGLAASAKFNVLAESEEAVVLQTTRDALLHQFL